MRYFRWTQEVVSKKSRPRNEWNSVEKGALPWSASHHDARMICWIRCCPMMSYEMSCCFWGKRIRQQKPIHWISKKYGSDTINWIPTLIFISFCLSALFGVVRWCLVFSRNPAIATHSAKAVLWYSLKPHQIRKVGERRGTCFSWADEDDRSSLWC